MRVIKAELGEVRSVAVSPDGRLVAAAGANGWLALLDWADGATVRRDPLGAGCEQLAFGASSELVYVQHETLRVDRLGVPATGPNFAGRCVTAAVAPDGKTLVATQVGAKERAELKRWALPSRQPLTGFGFWSPFRRLVFSPDGEFLAGIWDHGFELRFANSGGLDYRSSAPRGGHAAGFVAFDRDSNTCAFGWEDEFHVLDVSTGTSKVGPRVKAAFSGAAFSPGADLFATVGADGRLRFWNPTTWAVTREYDWRCGPLTCLAFTADGSAGVCGTADGRLVQFDVDE